MKKISTEEKSLLLQDLATRLPYGVKVFINSYQMELFDVNFASETIGVSNEKWTFRAIHIDDVKPYLRPMSSMTRKERLVLLKWGTIGINEKDEVFDVYPYGMKRNMNVIDFLNAHHFDYRGLIEKGLALVAPDGMYNIN